MININPEEYEIVNYGNNGPIPIKRIEECADGLICAVFDCKNYYNDRIDEYHYYLNAKTLADPNLRSNNRIRLRKRGRQVPKDVFRIRCGHPSWDKDEWQELETIEDLDTAKDRLKLHKQRAQDTNSPFRFMMKKEVEMGTEVDYDEWAAFRFESGEWEPTPWHNEPWIKPELAHHFTHMCSERDPGVAYWATPEMAQKDMLSSKTVGSYLTEFYSDVLTPEQIEEYVHQSDPPGELEFTASDPDEIYEAYTSYGNIHSCMGYHDDSGNFYSIQNPVRVYGAGDLCVALLRRRGNIVARALVWPEKKVAGRQYGDDRRMRIALEAAGYTLDGGHYNSMEVEGRGGFNGARLLKIIPEEYPNNVMMPYVDFKYRVNVHEDHCTLDLDGEFVAHRTDGLLVEPHRSIDDGSSDVCADCGDNTDGDNYNVGDQTWCYSCYENDATSCDSCGHTVATRNLTDVNGYEYCQSCVDQHTTTCDYCDEHIRLQDVVQVINANTGERYLDACASCVEYNVDIVVDNQGRNVDRDTTVECEGCSQHFPSDNPCNCNEEEELEAAA